MLVFIKKRNKFNGNFCLYKGNSNKKLPPIALIFANSFVLISEIRGTRIATFEKIFLMSILYLKALHIIFVVTWFAGLFYIVRLFIYHTEANELPEVEKNILQKQYKLMEKRLWYGITWPSMILTFVFGTWMIVEMYGWDVPIWLLLKLAFVFGLLLYHIQCHVIFNQLKKDVIKWSSMKLRFWNELTTLFLVSIVFIVVLKDMGSFVKGIIGLLLFAAALSLAIIIYKRSRKKKE